MHFLENILKFLNGVQGSGVRVQGFLNESIDYFF
jgi:hypothetical protein